MEEFLMNKSEVVTKIAEKSNLSKKDSEKALEAFLETVVEEVRNGGNVQLIGFGNFECRERKERKGRDPRSGAEITISASCIPAFKAGKVFKDAVNEK